MPLLAAVSLLLTAQTPIELNTPPRNVWVFRSVLDHRARMSTIALAEEFWVAYDATNCGIYKFWSGSVSFDGAVYTTVHGPQPTSKGGAYVQGEVDKPVWHLLVDSSPVNALPKFRGYKILPGNVVRYQFEITYKDKTFRIYETPMLLRQGNNAIGLSRKFEFEVLGGGAIPKGVQFSLNGFDFEKAIATGGAAKASDRITFDGTPGKVVHPITPKAIPPTVPKNLFASVDPSGPLFDPTNQDKQDVREPGLAFRAYQLDRILTRIPKLVPNQSPNVSRKIDQVGFLAEEDFGIAGKFYVNISGWIKIETPGLYHFRLGSDDGSRLKIRNEQVVDHDGVHTATSKDGSMELGAGSHEIQIEYFNNDADAFLQLEWKRQGDANWDLVPAEAFETLATDVKVVAPGAKKVMDSLFPFRPGDGTPEVAVHPSFDLSTPRPADFNPRVGGFDFLPDGRMVICTWDADGAVYVVEGVQSGDPNQVKVTQIATGLAEPLGIKVHDGAIYVFQKQELTKLVDTDGDGKIDEFYALANGFGVTENFHEFSFGLVYDKGYFYGNLALGINPGGRSTGTQDWARGRVIKINAKTGDFEFVAAGLRTPNGIMRTAKGEILLTDNQGDWVPSCKLLELIPGAFYGNRSVEPQGTEGRAVTAPICWFPQGEIGNSISQPAPFEYGPYKGQIVVGDVTHGGLKRVQMEKVNGRYQGTAFRMTQGLEAGINRVIVGPDKAIYVGGIGSTGNWGQEGKERYGLQRLAYNGKTTFEMLAVKPCTNGLQIELTEPLLDNGLPYVREDFIVNSWTYVPTIEYGGPKVDEKAHVVKSLSLSSDRKSLFIEVDGIAAGRVYYTKLPTELSSKDRKQLWSTEAWTTINNVPQRLGKVQPLVTTASRSELSAQEKAEGFVSLFNGTSLDNFRGYNRKDLPKGWVLTDGSLTYVPGVEGGDIITKEQYGDFELRLEWRIAEGGNSGIMYRVRELDGPSYMTGTEMQVLDDARHPDGKNAVTSAGSSYALYPPTQNVVLPANHWNQIRLICKGNKIEHWLNGVKVVEYDKDSADFKDRLAKSKFKDWAEFAKYPSGYLAFQDHGDIVAYRNIRIRKL